MSNIEFIKKKVIHVFIFVFFWILFMCYDDPFENYFLLLSFIGLIMMIKSLKEIDSLKKILILVFIMIFVYLMTIFFLFTMEYKMVLEKKYNKTIDGKAILIVFDGEGEQYDIYRKLTNISLEDSLYKKLKTPFLLYNYKIKYRKIGKSSYFDNTNKIKERVSIDFNDKDSVYIGYLRDKNYIEEKIFELVDDGYHNVTVVPIFISENEKLFMLKKRIERLKFYNLNIKIIYTEPLWNSDRIAMSYIEKIRKNINMDKINDVGIVLIGQATGLSSNESVKQDIMFREKIKNYLVNRLGIEGKRVRLSWFQSLEPSYIKEIEELLEYGVGNILCVFIKPCVTNIENLIIAEKIKKELEVPEGVRIRVIDGFVNDDNLIDEITRRIEFVNLNN